MADGTYFNLMRMCRNVINAEIKPDLACGQFVEMTKSRPDVSVLLLDVLSTFDMEMESADSDKKTLFKQLCNLCSKNNVIPDDILRLGIESMCSVDGLNGRSTKIRTKIYFKQLKFNLLREESEGYGKLIAELGQDISEKFDSKIALERIRCLIGQFNLDPNRVLDIILECFETRLEKSQFFIGLLRLYKSSPEDICQLLGFKFTFYQARFKSKGDVPESLYRLTALLLHHKMVDLLALYPFLVPKHKELLESLHERRKQADEKAKSSARVSTLAENDAPSTASSIFAVDSEPVEAEDESSMLGENQKLGLLCALLETGDWTTAKDMMDHLPDGYGVANSRRVALAIVALVDRLITPLYQEKCTDYTPFFGNDQSNFVSDTAAPVSSWQELHDVVFPILEYLGPHLGYSAHSMVKLVRLLAAFATEKHKLGSRGAKAIRMTYANILKSVVNICDVCVVPAITILDGNGAISEEVWTLLSQLPYSTRYLLYGRWKREHTNRHPALLIRKGRVQGKTRYVMKRLSKETIRLVGRQLGKLSHTHPGVVFDQLLSQIQTFDNLIGPVVESMRYLTSLEFDVLSYCIIEELAAPAKQKLKVSDATLSPWLQSLATFVGTAFKRYNMELTGVLQYVANQLKDGNSVDLLVLKEVIQNMSGIETATALTQEQLEALSGGELLRQEGGQFGQVRNVKRTTNRLKEALFQDDLVVSLCILTAQQRASIVYKEGQGLHLKLVGQMLDQCQETLVQFGNFLLANLKPEDYAKRMPSAADLIRNYHLPIDATMFLARPICTHAIISKYDEMKKKERASKGTVSAEQKTSFYVDAFCQMSHQLAALIERLFTPSAYTSLNWRLATTFWSLSMYDLSVPAAAYEREMEKMHKSIEQVELSREISDSKRRKEKDRLVQLEQKLKDEQRKQEEHTQRVTELLKSEKDKWFSNGVDRLSQNAAFVQKCIISRAIFSESDALYAARFIEVLHDIRAANFQTIMIYDRIFNTLLHIIPSLSENEAHFFGRFLSCCMETVGRWHRSKATFDKECANTIGFFIKQRIPNKPDKDRLDYEGFRNICNRWHVSMTRMICNSIFQSGSYVGIRNSFIILLKTLHQYPIVKGHYELLEKRVAKVRDDEKDTRQDLSLLAASYWGQLKVRKVPDLIQENQFHIKETPANKVRVNATSSPNSSLSTTLGASPAKPSEPVTSTVTNAKKITSPASTTKSEPKQAGKTAIVAPSSSVTSPKADGASKTVSAKPAKEVSNKEAAKPKEPQITRVVRTEEKTDDQAKTETQPTPTSKPHLKRQVVAGESAAVANSELKRRREEKKIAKPEQPKSPVKSADTDKVKASVNAANETTTSGSRKIKLHGVHKPPVEKSSADSSKPSAESSSKTERKDGGDKKPASHASRDAKDRKPADTTDAPTKVPTKRVVVDPSSTSESTSRGARTVIEPVTANPDAKSTKSTSRKTDETKQRTAASTPQSDKSDASTGSGKRLKRGAMNGASSAESKRARRSHKEHESGRTSRSVTPSTRTVKTSKEHADTHRDRTKEHSHRSASRDKERRIK